MRVFHFFSISAAGTLEHRIAQGKLQLVGAVEIADADISTDSAVAAQLEAAADKLSLAERAARRPVCAYDFLQIDATGDLYEVGVQKSAFRLVCRAWGVAPARGEVVAVA